MDLKLRSIESTQLNVSRTMSPMDNSWVSMLAFAGSKDKSNEAESSHVLVKKQIQQSEVNEITLEFQETQVTNTEED